ncbi:DNA topoisomerase IB [Lysobacter sp. TLK-CK17T]|uniref:DNA topoisomerase n=2 Tax=Marilutibacter chinensis TaxID=2912247 RepID=A0ABS9HU50_9GAMM|nr:DNA topoisomerase IB [Lysobacter chinensis]MCF7222404.1 DNA topoisomerase IB [Lysobacter chinensis]
MSPRGHLQATGRDSKGRKQYRYHPRWRKLRDEHKFDRVAEFCAALPDLRRAIRRDLDLPGLPRDKVIAVLVWIMSATLLRIGNAAYARDNASFGLTTLRNRHARFLRDRLRLRFNGKGGRIQEVDVSDPRLVRLVRRMHQLPGQALFQYRDADGELQRVDSSMVNDYLHERMGQNFTAKDFRTWGATVAAFRLLASIPAPDPADADSATAIERQVVASVAAMLGNTAAVCRKSYIDPGLFEAWRDGLLPSAGNRRSARQWETTVCRFLARLHR